MDKRRAVVRWRVERFKDIVWRMGVLRDGIPEDSVAENVVFAKPLNCH